jgi:hypothetical protein
MGVKVKYIRRNLMLKEIDIKWLPGGKRNIFSVKFVTKSGSIHYFPYAYATGLKYNMSEFRQRGIQECDEFGKSIGHVYPVSIDAILMFNKMEVIL